MQNWQICLILVAHVSNSLKVIAKRRVKETAIVIKLVLNLQLNAQEQNTAIDKLEFLLLCGHLA